MRQTTPPQGSSRVALPPQSTVAGLLPALGAWKAAFGGGGPVVIDGSAVECMDVAGLQLLAAAFATGRARLEAPAPVIAATFTRAGLPGHSTFAEV